MVVSSYKISRVTRKLHFFRKFFSSRIILLITAAVFAWTCIWIILVRYYFIFQRNSQYLHDSRAKLTTRHGPDNVSLSEGTSVHFDSHPVRLIQRVLLPVSSRNLSAVVSDLIKETQADLVYQNFSHKLPRFLSKRHEELFLMNLKNRKSLFEEPTVRQLIGRIEIIPDGIVHGTYDCGWTMNTSILSKRVPIVGSKKYKIILPLLVAQSSAFQHFVDGVFPKIVQSYGLIQRFKIPILLHRPRDKIISEMLERIGIPEKQIQYYGGGFVRSDIIINACITPPLHPALWKKMQSLLLNATSSAKLHLPEKKLIALITREDSRNRGRKILNIAEVSQNLSSRYGESFRLLRRHKNLTESIALFQRVCIIIGVHGGGLYNLLFAKEDANIIELMPTDGKGNSVPRGLAHTIIWQMSGFLGQPYWRIPIVPVDKNGNLEINLNELNRILDITDVSCQLKMNGTKQNLKR